MKTSYLIDTIRFDDEQDFLKFIRSDSFLVYTTLTVHRLKELSPDQTEQNALTFIAITNNNREVYLELIQCTWFDNFHQEQKYYKWETSYSYPHRAGGETGDPTDEQIELLKYFQNLTPELDCIIERIGLSTEKPENSNENDMPF